MPPGLVDVLLVEDTPADAELTLRALRTHHRGATVHLVRDGAEALAFLFATGAYAERAGEAPPRLVLLDLKLPKVDGIEVLRRLKADPRTRTVPVVILSSSREARDVVASYDLGVNSFVVKPVEFDGFLDAVSHVGRYWLDLNQAPAAV